MTDRLPGPVRLTPNRDASTGAGTAALKSVVRQVLGLDDRHTVVVQQLACAEPGCPPVETVVAVLAAGDQPRRWTLHKPLSDVTAEDIQVILTPGAHL
jgi:hypothetical protein